MGEKFGRKVIEYLSSKTVKRATCSRTTVEPSSRLRKKTFIFFDPLKCDLKERKNFLRIRTHSRYTLRTEATLQAGNVIKHRIPKNRIRNAQTLTTSANSLTIPGTLDSNNFHFIDPLRLVPIGTSEDNIVPIGTKVNSSFRNYAIISTLRKSKGGQLCKTTTIESKN